MCRIIRGRTARRFAHAGNGRLGKTDLLLDFVGEATLLGRERRIVSKQSGVAEDDGISRAMARKQLRSCSGARSIIPDDRILPALSRKKARDSNQWQKRR